VHSHFKNRPNCYSNHYTDKPRHLPSKNRLFQPEAKPISASPLQGIQPTAQPASAVQISGNASKRTHDENKLFNRQSEHAGYIKSAMVWIH